MMDFEQQRNFWSWWLTIQIYLDPFAQQSSRETHYTSICHWSWIFLVILLLLLLVQWLLRIIDFPLACINVKFCTIVDPFEIVLELEATLYVTKWLQFCTFLNIPSFAVQRDCTVHNSIIPNLKSKVQNLWPRHTSIERLLKLFAGPPHHRLRVKVELQTFNVKINTKEVQLLMSTTTSCRFSEDIPSSLVPNHCLMVIIVS